MKTTKDPAQLEAVGTEQRFVAEDDVKNVLEGFAEVLPLFVFRQHHVGDGVDEEWRTVECRGGVGVGSTHDGEPRDSGDCFEEALDNVLTLGEQRVVEPLQDDGRCG